MTSVPCKPMTPRYREAELELLQQFFQYAQSQGEHAKWLHWNMNSPSYGFAHLEHRYKMLSGLEAPFHIPERNRLDLDATMQWIYGQYYMCNPKLLDVVKRNRLEKNDMLSGDVEAFAFINGDWHEIEESAHSKVAVIYEIAQLAQQRKLITHTPNWRAHMGGWIDSTRTDHPVVFWATTLGAISAILSIWAWLSGVVGWLMQLGATRLGPMA